MLKELREHLVARRNAQALSLAETILQSQDESVDALHLCAIALARNGAIDRASDLFERALMITPEDPNLHMNLAQLHVAKGDLAQATKGYKAASMLDPNLALAHSSLGNLAAMGGDTRGAEELYLTALRADPNSVPALLGRGHLLLDRNDLKTAMPVAQKASQVAPKDARAQALFGRALLLAGNVAFATQAFRNAIELAPRFFAARVMLARALIAQNDFAEAETQLKQAASLAPRDVTLKLVRADLYARTRRPEQAAADLDDILASMQNMAALRARVALHFAAGEIDQGLALLEKSCIAHPKEWLLNHAYLGYLIEFGRTAQAREAALKWTERAPEFAPAWMHLATIEENQGQYDSAKEHAEKAFSLDESLPQVALIRARARLRLGHPGEAQTILNTMLAKDCLTEQRVEALSLRGRAQDALGQRNEAVTSWQEAAALRVTPSSLPPLQAPSTAPVKVASLNLKLEKEPKPTLIFLTGLPLSGAESVAWWLAHAPQTMVYNDRFSARDDARRSDFLNSTSEDRLRREFHDTDLEHIRSRYLKALRRLAPNAPLSLVVDWLPMLDVRQFQVLRAALPEARWLHVERDPRDAFLGALVFGSSLMPMKNTGETSIVFKQHAQHLSEISQMFSPRDFIFQFEQGKSEVTRLSKWLSAIDGVKPPDAARWLPSTQGLGGLPAYFPAQRWQAFEAPLSSAFKNL